ANDDTAEIADVENERQLRQIVDQYVVRRASIFTARAEAADRQVQRLLRRSRRCCRQPEHDCGGGERGVLPGGREKNSSHNRNAPLWIRGASPPRTPHASARGGPCPAPLRRARPWPALPRCASGASPPRTPHASARGGPCPAPLRRARRWRALTRCDPGGFASADPPRLRSRGPLPRSAPAGAPVA